MSDNKVQIIGIGAIKSGTSFLSDLLSQHPDIQWARRKEVNYFNVHSADGTPNPYAEKSIDFYHRFFPQRGNQMAEFSPIYLYDQAAPQRIYEYHPQAKLIAVLRNPVDRAYSHFLYAKHFLQSIDSNLSFEEAIEQYPYLLEMGLYGEQLQRYLDLWNTENIAIMRFEDLIHNTEEIYQYLLKFLGIDNLFVPDLVPVNQSKQVANPFINKGLEVLTSFKSILHKSSMGGLVDRFMDTDLYLRLLDQKYDILDRNVKPLTKEALNPETKKRLEEYYHQDWSKVQSLFTV